MLRETKLEEMRRAYSAMSSPNRGFASDIMRAHVSIWATVLEQIAQIRGANALEPAEIKPESEQNLQETAQNLPEAEQKQEDFDADWLEIEAELADDFA